MGESSDRALADWIVEGDASAFETLFRRHGEAVFRFVYGLTGDPHTAEDVTQDVFAWLWLHHRTWTPPHHLLSYLLGAARNRVISRGRHERIRDRLTAPFASAGESPAMSTAQPLPDTIAQYHTDAEVLWRIVGSLPEPRRTILLLRWQHGLEWPHIATVLQMSVAAVKMQHSRALATLRERFPDTFV